MRYETYLLVQATPLAAKLPPRKRRHPFCLLLERSRLLTKILAAARRGALVVLAGVLVAREMADDLTGFDCGKCITNI